MQAIRQHTFGPPDVLQLEVVPDPHPKPGEVRIRVASSGVHLLDTAIRKGVRAGPSPLPALPLTPGREVAGTVDELGTGVDSRWLNQRVVVDLGPASGGYAEFALAREASLHAIPVGLDFDAAVTMVGTGRTTMAILDVAAPNANEIAIITAAAGGIGTLLIQALRAAGTITVGLAGGSPKVSLVRYLRAEHAIDYADPKWTDTVCDTIGEQTVNLVLDGVGGVVGREAMNLLRVGGRLVMFGGASGELTQLSAADVFARGISVTAAVGARIARRPFDLLRLEDRALQAASSGQLVPVIGQQFALAGAARAHELIEARSTVGKTVLHP